MATSVHPHLTWAEADYDHKDDKRKECVAAWRTTLVFAASVGHKKCGAHHPRLRRMDVSVASQT